MDAQPPEPAVPTRRGARARQWIAQRKLSQSWKAAVVAILAVAALFGGLDRVDTSATPFAPGEEFSDGQFTVTLARARLVEQIEGGRRVIAAAKPGRVYLGVVATVRNDGTVPGTLRDELDLRDVPGAEFYGVFRNRDGSPITNVGPGLTEQLVFAWSLPVDVLTDDSVITIRVWKKALRQLMVTYGGKVWLDTDDYGVTELVVGAPTA
ncbi:hypothetical protein PDG61_07500 [Mycolicibacterium sp. BiH015]|uniref:hypothetical protein n=1 Tax=Mycolicibacterium sp. BiH015 TaxID=3018808 RepID=UPI0022E17041|nr:hypothetical protein [Mycolicibacterium sp. BiH015]MDA2890751.1 hypothetical protein [Mycolicibacterium sp. BiH015]